MVEAQGTTEESLFAENMRGLVQYSYHPCCTDGHGGNLDVWEDLQYVVCGFLVSQRGWLLEAPGSNLISDQEELAKDLLTAFINLSIDTEKLRIEAERKYAIDTEKLRIEAERKYEALKTMIAQRESLKKRKRQALTI